MDGVDEYTRRTQLRKMTKARLIAMYKNGVAAPDGRKVYYGGGMYPIEQWTKDEVVSSIVNIEYPRKEESSNGI
jgi:hypothetical protein